MSRGLIILGYSALLLFLYGSARVCSAEKSISDGDEEWERIERGSAEFYKMRPSSLEKHDFDEFLSGYSKTAGTIADQYKSYWTRYTNSPHAKKAWDKWMDLLNIAAHGDPARKTELKNAEEAHLADPTLDPRRRETIRINQIERTSDMKERERLIRAASSESKSPKSFLCSQILQMAPWCDFPHSQNLIQEILSLTEGVQTLDHYRQTALEIKTTLDRIGHPLELKFTALGGQPIDLAAYRGKVILLDFWATWCPPCVAGIPKVKSIWKSLHKDGFEVIGISYDSERKDLESFIKNHDLKWPQFFHPEGMDAALVKSLGAPGPPAYWLIDRRGRLVDVNGSHEMEQKIRKLLAEKP